MLNGKRRTTIDTTYDKIKSKILELEYEPNLHLAEESLSQELGVSRTPLRQALYRLVLEGLVIKQPTGRIYVSALSEKEARDAFLVRELMEGLIVRNAVSCINTHPSRDTIINELEDSIHLMRRSAENRRQDAVIRYGNDFHSLLLLYNDNQIAINMLQQITNIISRYRRIGAYKDPEYISLQPVQEHEEILKKIKHNDALGAEIAMRSHIKRSLESTLKAFNYLKEKNQHTIFENE